MKATLTVERLKEVLHYEPSTGVFTWLQRAGKGQRSDLVGAVAGATRLDQYREIGIGRHQYKAHRLAYLYMTGTWPPHQIDHRDGIRSNNVWTNLRPATRPENMQNLRKARCDNKSGVLGVTKIGSEYRARIVVDGKRRYLGTRDTPEAAGALYLEAKERLHPFSTL